MQKNKPAGNFAKHVERLPELKDEVREALSNEYSQKSQNFLPIYYIHHVKVYYKGPWQNSLPNGKGICLYPDGTYFQGQFINGEPNDEHGLLILSNGAAYKGNIKHSKINGKGIMRHNLGNHQVYVYEGTWVDGKPHGHGKEQYGDGSQYEGLFEHGYKQCIDQSKTIQQKKNQFEHHGYLSKQAKYRSKDGQVYTGEFKNGLMNGFGEYIHNAKKIKYIGEFKNGKKKGFGSLVTQIGTLTGNFQNDVINGKGEFAWLADKKVYKGHFERNQPHGEGQIYLVNGNVLQGVWQNGHNVRLTAIASGSQQFTKLLKSIGNQSKAGN